MFFNSPTISYVDSTTSFLSFLAAKPPPPPRKYLQFIFVKHISPRFKFVSCCIASFGPIFPAMSFFAHSIQLNNFFFHSARWGPWTAWSPCMKTCGTGVSLRSRECLTGANCRGPGTETRKCKIQDCPCKWQCSPKQNLTWNMWLYGNLKILSDDFSGSSVTIMILLFAPST